MKYIQKLIVMFSLFLSSCNTSELWSDKANDFNSSYDNVKEFMISEDGHKIIILGKKYHYIFDDESGEIKKILTWSGRAKLKMIVYDFELLSSSEIKGSIVISAMGDKELSDKKSKPLSENELKFLKDLNFAMELDEKNNIPQKRFDLRGTRYLPKAGVNYKTNSPLNQEYKIRIINNGFSGKVEKIALTPVTVTTDAISLAVGVVALGVTVVVLVAVMPLVLVTCIADPKHTCFN